MIPNTVKKILLRFTDVNVREGVAAYLSEWERERKALTRAISAGLHRQPPPTRSDSGLVPASDTAGAYFFAPNTCLDFVVLSLARKYIRYNFISKRDERDAEKAFLRRR